VLLNACALCASALALRFPPFWEKDGGPVSMETAIGEEGNTIMKEAKMIRVLGITLMYPVA